MFTRLHGLLSNFMDNASNYVGIPDLHMNFIDVLEIIILAYLLYHFLIWIKTTRAWNLFRGILVILFFVLIAAILQMTTIIWLAKNLLSVGLIALVVIFQPELRSALENLGGRKMFARIFEIGKETDERFSEKTIEELIRASYAMGKVKTGALIVIEDEILLNDYIRTGINVDGLVTSQLLINIFEKNTPLHDGAIIVRGDRVVAATCYLPLSDSVNISKDLGTRHRAAIGISEVSDSMTIIVSEETGKVSLAYHGNIYHGVTDEFLREKLQYLQKRNHEAKGFELLKRRVKNGKKDSKRSDE